MDAVKPAAGLIRMVVVNTQRFRDRYEELPLDEHTAIIAPNQSGKTSLMKLVPFFLGATPSQIQPQSAERKGFIEFYLPTTSSYVACEYRNAHGEVRSVVAHTDPQKRLVQYRLIRGGLTKDLFVKEKDDGTLGFVLNADFEANARRLGIEVNPRLITAARDYRGVIQGRYPEGSVQDKSAFLGLIHEYGIGRRNNSLDNIDQLFLTTIDNKFSIADLIAVVTNKIVDFSDRKIRVLGGSVSQDTLSLVDDFRAYHKVMALEPLFREAQSAETQRKQFDARAKDLLKRLAGAGHVAEMRVSELDQARHESTILHSEAVERLDEEKNGVVRSRTESDVRIHALETEIRDIDRKEQHLHAAGADRAADLLAELPGLRARRETIEQMLSLKDKGRAEIEAEHARIIAGIRDSLRETLSAVDNRLIEIPEEIEAIRLSIEAAARELEATVEGAHAAHLEEIDAALAGLAKRRDAILEELSDVTADAQAVEKLDRMAARKRDKESELAAIATRAGASRAAFKEAEDGLTAAGVAVRDQQAKVAGLQRDLRDIQTRREPAAGSLQAWLERNRPDWRDNIGKVIDERILAKIDLSPSEIDGNGFFGVKIDLDRIGGGCPALETLEREQAEAAERLATAELDLVAARAAESKAASRRSSAVKARDTDEAQENLARQNLESAENSLKAAKAEVAASLDARRASLRDSRAVIDGEIETARKRRTQLMSDHRAQIAASRQETGARIAAGTAHLLAEKARLTDQKANLAAQAKLEVDAQDARRAALLADGELGAAAVRELTDELTAISKHLGQAATLEDQARQWADFLSVLMPRRAEYGDNVIVLRNEIEVFDSRIAEIAARRKELASTHAKALADIDARRTVMVDMMAAARERLKTETADVVLPDDLDACNPLDIKEMLEELHGVEKERKRKTDAIAAQVRALRNGFNDISGRIRDLHRSQARALGNKQEGPAWLGIFEDWFDTGHATMHETILSQIGMVATPIRESSRRLQEIDAEVSQVSKRLRGAIAKLPQFPGVSEVDLHLRSRLRSEGFWADMENFVRHYESWSRDPGMVEIDGLVEALEAYLSHWPVGTNPEIDLRDQLFIEGQLREGLELKKLTRDTDIGKLSSEGGSSIIRLIILTAAIELIRGQQDVRFTWCVDEFGRLDRANSRHLIDMLSENRITLVTGAPALSAGILSAFPNRISIVPKVQTTTLVTVDATGTRKHGIREWNNEGLLVHPEETRP